MVSWTALVYSRRLRKTSGVTLASGGRLGSMSRVVSVSSASETSAMRRWRCKRRPSPAWTYLAMARRTSTWNHSKRMSALSTLTAFASDCSAMPVASSSLVVVKMSTRSDDFAHDDFSSGMLHARQKAS